MSAKSATSVRRDIAGVLVAAFTLAGCGTIIPPDYFDPDAEATRDTFTEGLAARPAEETAEPPPPIPELQPIISAPALGPEVQSRWVTVSVTETTPIKDVLIELAREARIGLELDPRVEGGIIFSAYDRPFEDVIRRIADLAGLRYKMRDGVIRIELDDPYHVNYKIGYLSIVRTATSEVGTSAAVTGEGSGGSGSNASSSRVSSDSEADFWAELEANITQILTNTAKQAGLLAQATAAPVAAAAASAAPATTAPAPATQPGVQSSLDVLSMLAERREAGTAVPVPTQPAAIGAAPTVAPTSAAAIPGLQPAFASASSLFMVNRQAGILSVFGTERQHREIGVYVRWLRSAIAAQVLIEAKVLEVSLDNEFRFGINWASLLESRFNVAAPFNTATTPAVVAPPFDLLIAAPADPITATANVLTVAGGGNDFNAIANLVEEFGTVRALSSPRLTVMQNQTAVIKVAENDVFFEVTVEQNTQVVNDQQVTDRAVSSELKTVTVDLVMTVQPPINLETDEITLTLRPTITRIVRQENDPAVDLEEIAGVVSQVPVIGVQEIDSVVTIPSGNVIVMGGLMQDRSSVNEVGIPWLSDIPWLGQAFKSTERDTEKSELVIFLRATIVRGNAIDPYDAELYKLFGQDRRPLQLN